MLACCSLPRMGDGWDGRGRKRHPSGGSTGNPSGGPSGSPIAVATAVCTPVRSSPTSRGCVVGAKPDWMFRGVLPGNPPEVGLHPVSGEIRYLRRSPPGRPRRAAPFADGALTNDY
jgi:hypothetical protein